MQNRPVRQYRTALHISYQIAPERIIIDCTQIISSPKRSGKGRIFIPIFTVATSQRPYERSMIYGTVKNKEARINLAIQL